MGRGRPSFSQGFTCPDLLNKQIIKFAALGIPGFHCLWRNFPEPSARIAIFLLYAGGGSSCFLLQHLVYRNSRRNPISQNPQKGICMLQPSLSIHLPTYPSRSSAVCENEFHRQPKLKNGNLKSLGSCRFARHYFGNRCLLSIPRGTKMFQFPRLPLSCPIYSGWRHMTLLI